jgi:hypothetical protein
MDVMTNENEVIETSNHLLSNVPLLSSRGKPEIKINLDAAMIFDHKVFASRFKEKKPTRRLNFEDEFPNYIWRVDWESSYHTDVRNEAEIVQQKINKLPHLPQVIYCIPVRAENGTSVTVQTILSDCKHSAENTAFSDIQAFIIIFNNFEHATEQSSFDDLEKVRNLPNVHVIDRKVPTGMGMSNIRSFPVDIGLYASYQNDKLRENPPIIASADGDITGYLETGTIQAVLDCFSSNENKDQVVDAVVLPYVEDVDLLKKNFTLFAVALIAREFNLVQFGLGLEKMATVGASSFFDAAAFCAVGGFPPVSMGEDRYMSEGFSLLRGNSKTSITLGSYPVQLNDLKKTIAKLANTDYYENWESRRNQLKEPVPDDQGINLNFVVNELATSFYSSIISLVSRKVREGISEELRKKTILVFCRLFTQFVFAFLRDSVDFEEVASLKEMGKQLTQLEIDDMSITEANSIVLEAEQKLQEVIDYLSSAGNSEVAHYLEDLRVKLSFPQEKALIEIQKMHYQPQYSLNGPQSSHSEREDFFDSLLFSKDRNSNRTIFVNGHPYIIRSYDVTDDRISVYKSADFFDTDFLDFKISENVFGY